MFEWKRSELEDRVWQEQLNDFVPQQVFDTHVHIWDDSCATEQSKPGGPREVFGVTKSQEYYREVLPGREVDFNVLSTPVVGMDFYRNTECLAREMAKTRYHIGTMGVSPELSCDYIAQSIEKYGFKGLKPYLLFAEKTFSADITDFLPERQVEVADHYGLSITLHMSKVDCCADKMNQQILADFTRRYPRVKWILAHCARSFNPIFLEESLDFWRNLPNIWYDLSAVTDLRSHYLLYKHEDISRLMFGSDNMLPGLWRGSYVCSGRQWIFHENNDGLCSFYEQLLSQKRAAEMAGWNESDIQKMFFDNAAKFFGFDQ